MTDKLTKKYIDKTQKGERINITDLYEFSKIKLKRSRIRKKFNKHYDRYVSKEVKLTYWNICLTTPLLNSFKLYWDVSKKMSNILSIDIIDNIYTKLDKNNDAKNV